MDVFCSVGLAPSPGGVCGMSGNLQKIVIGSTDSNNDSFIVVDFERMMRPLSKAKYVGQVIEYLNGCFAIVVQ
jgi:hypothetical protein